MKQIANLPPPVPTGGAIRPGLPARQQPVSGGLPGAPTAAAGAGQEMVADVFARLINELPDGQGRKTALPMPLEEDAALDAPVKHDVPEMMPMVARGNGFAVGAVILPASAEAGPEDATEGPVAEGDLDVWTSENESIVVATLNLPLPLPLPVSAERGVQVGVDGNLDAIASKQIVDRQPLPMAVRDRSGGAGPLRRGANAQAMSGQLDDGASLPRSTEGPVKQSPSNPGVQAASVSVKAGEPALAGAGGDAGAGATPVGNRESVSIAAVREVDIPSGRTEADEVRRVVVRLEPQHFGKVSVAMVRRGEEFSMRVMPEQAATADLLRNDTGVLAQKAAGEAWL